MHPKLVGLGFKQCMTDMFLYIIKNDRDVSIVGVYVDNVLVTENSLRVVDHFSRVCRLFIKGLGYHEQLRRLTNSVDVKSGYVLDQKVMIDTLLISDRPWPGISDRGLIPD